MIFLFINQDYSEMSKAYRPSHADATYDFKYGVRSVQVYSIGIFVHMLIIIFRQSFFFPFTFLITWVVAKHIGWR